MHFLNVICFPIFERFCRNKQKLELELQQSKPGQLEIPKLRKVQKEEPEPEKKKEDEKKEKAKKVVKKKRESDYELPEIPDYERPELEKYEKSDFDPTRRVSWGQEIKNVADHHMHRCRYNWKTNWCLNVFWFMFNVMDEKICLSLKTLPTCVCKTLQKILVICVARQSKLIFESESI